MTDSETGTIQGDGEAILDELRRVDETTLRFSPWGFGGRLEPASSVRFLSESLTYAALVDAVPEDLRLNFERVRRLFLYGLLEYDFFSAAYDQRFIDIPSPGFRRRGLSLALLSSVRCSGSARSS